MAFSGGKPLTPFTITQGQGQTPQAPPASSTASFTFGGGVAPGSGFTFGGGPPVGGFGGGAGGSAFNFGGGQQLGGGGGGGLGSGLSFGGAAATSISAPQLSFVTSTSAPAPPASQLSFGPSTSTPASSSASILGISGAQATAQPQPIATKVIISPPNIVRSTLGQSQSTIGQLLGAQSTASQAAQSTAAQAEGANNNVNVPPLSFRQLQDMINQWMLDLQEQEKAFLEEATRVNSWDRALVVNGDKIAQLNQSIAKVHAEHSRLEHALEYIKTQQQEFEGFLEPLEAGLPANLPVEPERAEIYSLTEVVDTQLQQMTEDLKEVICHINESNKTVDKNDPVSQILRILNEHMDALHWVENSSNQIKRALDDVSQQQQNAKREHERSLRMMFK